MENCGKITVIDRKTIDMTGVESVDSFDEHSITLIVSCGKLVVEGEGLSITVLDLDKGLVSASGSIHAVSYQDGAAGKAGASLRAKLFGKA